MTVGLLVSFVIGGRLLASGGPLSRVLQTVALASRFQDVTVVREAIEHVAGEPLAAEYYPPTWFLPAFERKLGSRYTVPHILHGQRNLP